ncbi:DUF2929 domain-containing protein [Planococcus maritimus]|uniref:YjzD family protein n=1 Tax=Planococcus maritimus TaxID=192421 RepID=UPI00080F116B|nr:YjzD family protein [Planococcus maritimus]ANU17656.1 DUF2929 domain-containing protein [Planococcus maritimus]
MQYIGTLFWSVLIISMLNYVVSAVQNVPFDFPIGLVMAVAVTVLIIVMDAIIPKEAAKEY